MVIVSKFYMIEKTENGGVLSVNAKCRKVIVYDQNRLGYISATGDPIYVNEFINDPDNIKYFLNLFALACRAGQVIRSRGVGISRLASLI